MRILLVHNHYQQYGGEETYFNTLTSLLKKNGHTVRLYEKNSQAIVTLTQKIASAVHLFWNPAMERELGKLIQTFKPDIVQFQNVYPLISPAAYRVCRHYRIPVIQRISSYRLVCPKGWLFRNNRICEACVAKRFAYPAFIYGCYHESRPASLVFSIALFFHRYILKSYNFVDKYLFPSLFIKDYFVNGKVITARKAVVIPTSDNPVSSYQHTISKRDNYFLYAGRLSAEKGIHSLLDLLSRTPTIRLIVIGLDQNNTLKKKYKKYSNIVFTGFLKKAAILSYMKNATATVMPSLWYDVLPNVLIESFSVGTPVIAPGMGVFPQLIIDKQTGRLYDNMDELQRLLIKFKKTVAVENAVLKAYRHTYLPERHYASLVALYEQTIKSY